MKIRSSIRTLKCSSWYYFKYLFLLLAICVSEDLIAFDKIVTAKKYLLIDCFDENNSKTNVSALSNFKLTQNKSILKIGLVWQMGNCADVINMNGHISKIFNNISTIQIKDNQKLGNIESHTTDSINFSYSEIVIPTSSIDESKYFIIRTLTPFSYGIFHLEIIKSIDQENNIKYKLLFQ